MWCASVSGCHLSLPNIMRFVCEGKRERAKEHSCVWFNWQESVVASLLCCTAVICIHRLVLHFPNEEKPTRILHSLIYIYIYISHFIISQNIEEHGFRLKHVFNCGMLFDLSLFSFEDTSTLLKDLKQFDSAIQIQLCPRYPFCKSKKFPFAR